ncbi:MAG: GNAT family N-acetyltransferase [Saprospiraceae bacterium]|nr:GNAT family N-acetyltransferase [Saprospiraceae bacterium]
MNREIESQFTGRIFLKGIAPEALDQYLAMGWYRMGLTIFTTHFLFFDHEILSAIWLRVPLSNYHFKKSLRKVINKAKSEFTVSYRKANLDEEREALYRKYTTAFKGRLPVTLRSSLLDGENMNPFNSFEVNVHHGDKLIAYSIFDSGRNSITSITGVYDPDYSQYSLGLFTMLMEIEYAMEHGYEYFYPGYFVPGNERFNYKLRTGQSEFYELKSKSWLPIEHYNEEKIPIQTLKEKLSRLEARMLNTGLDVKMWHYPFFEARMIELWSVMYLEYPVFIELEPEKEKHGTFEVIIYDLFQELYVHLTCKTFESLPSNYNKTWLSHLLDDKYFADILVMDQIHHYDENEERFIDYFL